MSRNTDRAEGATKVARVIEFLAACLLIFVAFYGLGYLSIVGDEIQAARIAAEQCEKYGANCE